MKIDFKTVLKGSKGKALEMETGEKNAEGKLIMRDLTLDDVVTPLLIAPMEMNQKAAMDVKRRLYKLWMQIENSEDKVLEVPRDLLSIVLERVCAEKSFWGILVQMQIEEIFNGGEVENAKTK